MKKLIQTTVFMVVFILAGYAQNSVQPKFTVPASYLFFQPAVNKGIKKQMPVKKINILTSATDHSNPFLSGLPVIKLKETTKRKPALFTAELSLNDMLENSLNSINAGLLNTYDDSISELFKDAPSLVKFKCIISL
jgi:hypothetical protein